MDVVLAIIKNPAIVGATMMLFGLLVAWLFDNKMDKKETMKMILEYVQKAESVTEEGTYVDTFLDGFIVYFEQQKGRLPSAGELKTGLDMGKDYMGINFEKRF